MIQFHRFLVYTSVISWVVLFSSRSRCCLGSGGGLISSLPGQPGNISFKQFSGYIVTDAEHGRALFYYFVEADSPHPLLLPLTLWLNGGPGCSSLGFGAFMEHGPFQPRSDGVLLKNKYSWNLESNMLYVESPIGVGFSYSNTSSDYISWNDTQTAQDNLQFIINWFKEFPSYRDSDLYLTGESYAGHYIPQLAALLLDYNKQPNIKPVKLKAIALGNPLLDIEISVNDAEFLWSHGVISDEMLMLKNTVCNESKYLLEFIHHNLSKECANVFQRMKEEMGSDTDTSDLLLPTCLLPSVTQFAPKGVHNELLAKVASTTIVGDPCLSDRVFIYLNKPQVQEALQANTTHLPYSWSFCSGPLMIQYATHYDIAGVKLIRERILQSIFCLSCRDFSEIKSLSCFIKLIPKSLKLHLCRISGDQDSKIPLTQTRIIANMLARQLKLVTFGRYSPWYDNMQVAGWSQSFGVSRKGENVTYLTFATVRGAAHEVPFTSPSQALTLFRAFLQGSPLPKS
ncbi:unnamed protein product [Camellia sinensis]